MQIQAILKNFGLSEKEVSVYLALINLGPSSVRDIALKSKVNRGTTYDILKSLISLGIVSYYNKETKQYFTAEEPGKLLSALDQKMEDIKEVKKSVQTNLPFLQTLFEKQGGKPVVRFYEGLKGVRNILQDVLDVMKGKKDSEYFVYSSSNVRENVHKAMPDFSKKRVKAGVRVKTIALGPGGHLNGLDERKWLPQGVWGQSLKSTYELMYGGRVAHISLSAAGQPIGVVVENEEIYQTQKMIFEFVWKSL